MKNSTIVLTLLILVLIQLDVSRGQTTPKQITATTTSQPPTTPTKTTTSTTATSTTTTTPEQTTPTDYCKNTSTCQNGGACQNGINKFTCECTDGFTGANCEINIDECKNSSCHNGANCTDGVNEYSCSCLPGYTGTQCGTDINDCEPSPCHNEATCHDQVNGYSCSCLQGYTGTQCETGLLDVEITGGPYIVEEGTSVITLQCNISDSNTLLSVQWFKIKSELSQLINVNDSNGKYSESMASKPSLSIHQINQSVDEARYICSAENIAGWKNSSSVLLNVTDILPPKSIQLQGISTTGFTIHIDQASFPLFNIKLNDTKKTNKNTNDTDYKIDELTPGTCYSIEVSTVVRDQFSKPVIKNICLPPAPPNSISKKEHTNDSLTFNIVHGKGKIDHFDIFINGIYKSSTTQDQKGPNDTTAVIHDLVPGTLYDQISVMTDTNGLKSSLVMMNPYATYPDPPADIEVIEPTDKCCISLNIAEGFGRTESFYVYVNDTRKITFIVSNTNYTTGNITDLLPGRFYQIQVAAFSNELESVKKSISAVTEPNAPQIKISTNSTTTKQIFGTISQTDGGSDKFKLFCAENPNLNFSINHSNFIINDLEPGHRYQIQATATFHDHISDKSELIPVCTVPHKPEVTVDKTLTSTSMIQGTISQTIGGKDNFTLYVDDKKYSEYTITNSSYVIRGLNPGRKYKIQATTTFCSLESVMTDPVEECTVPYPPSFEIDNKTTTKSISGTIHNIKGGYDNFTLYCDCQTKLNYTIQGDKYRIHDLEAGERYHCQASSTFCQYTSTRTNLTEECTVPYQPSFEINSKSTTTKSISGTIRQTKGGSDKFTLYCEDQTKLNYTIQGGKYRINNLKPGKRYSCQATAAFCQHTSARTNLIKECTVPSTPKFTINSPLTTTETISGSISLSDGGHDNFILDCDNVDKLNYSIHGGKYTIKNLIPGQLYKCQAWSTFCKHKSAISASLNESTVPTKPTFDVNKSTNEKMELNITKGNGVVEEYIVTMTPVDVDQCSTYQPIKTKTLSYSTNKAQETVVNIQSLNPGTLYNISVTSVSNGRHSLPHYLQHATDASPPLSVATDINKDSITFTITKGGGCVKYFIISIDGREYNVTALKDKEMTRYTVNNLDPSTTYKVTISVVSKGAETSQRQISFKTKNDPVPVIGGVIGAVLALLVIGIFVVSWRRQAMCFRKNKSTEVLDGKTNVGFEEEVEMADSRKKRPVKLTDFPRHVEYLSRNANMGFAAEFKELGVLSPKHFTNAAQLQENRPKNRYTNILPFDLSIVKLVGADDEPGSDFINANFIPGKRSPREYIAAQGPLPATKEDMWSMIWEQNASIVVMLTQIVERGRKKCEIYWPENLNEKMFLGDVIVEVETLSHLPDYVLRTIVLRLGDVEKRLRHYNYIAWPDMGTPATTDNMISFVDTVRKDIRPDMKGPIVVHCSAGVGRTGTFIVMDILLQEIRSQCKEVDIFGTILNLRNNRVNMVQTEDQYIFIHNCVRDFIEASDDEEEEVVDDEQRNEPIYQNV